MILAACGEGVEIDDPEATDAGADGEEADAGAITIGWTPPDITGVFQTATDFFEQAAEQASEHGLDVEVLSRSPETHVDFGDQVAIVEDYITSGVDVIAISPADTEAIKPAIDQAEEAGIPVVMVNLLEEQEDVEIASYIGFDNTEAAKVSAYSVLDYYGGPGVLGDGEQVDVGSDEFLDLEFWEDLYADVDLSDIEAEGVIIEGIAGTFFSEARLTGFREVIDQAENVEIIAEPIAGDWNREEGIDATETFLSRFGPGELDFIWAASNEMGLGAMLTAEREGRLDDTGGSTPPDDELVAVFTNDVTPESTEAIRQGQIIAETHHGFAEWGWFGTEFAVRLACGMDVPEFEDIRPRTAWEGNADLFYPDPALRDIDWEEIAAECEA
ncbi:sugar ABC transporter substrate-binding protein [Actinobacteria bacterium YIM 96077]|uniref:Sugar ABC transporter substrate-binding protein n=2 Tax=Phytoactinopolyspora halophila TaxID=1981511 RepID=A0A329QPG7_9ACTN|nr:sugar ABC transporter substrate-binding protein [Actinobacteria bacterium YIM 96077]RAW14230.1 sugar ABC transporter substrate-binding protein [Phytoactinopolyspora halophila]